MPCAFLPLARWKALLSVRCPRSIARVFVECELCGIRITGAFRWMLRLILGARAARSWAAAAADSATAEAAWDAWSLACWKASRNRCNQYYGKILSANANTNTVLFIGTFFC